MLMKVEFCTAKLNIIAVSCPEYLEWLIFSARLDEGKKSKFAPERFLFLFRC